MATCNQKWKFYLGIFSFFYFLKTSFGQFQDLFVVFFSLNTCFTVYAYMNFPTPNWNLTVFSGFFAISVTKLYEYILLYSFGEQMSIVHKVPVVLVCLVLAFFLFKTQLRKIRESDITTIKFPTLIVQKI